MPVKATLEQRRYNRIVVSPSNLKEIAKLYSINIKTVFGALNYKCKSELADKIRESALKDFFGVIVKDDLELKWHEY